MTSDDSVHARALCVEVSAAQSWTPSSPGTRPVEKFAPPTASRVGRQETGLATHRERQPHNSAQARPGELLLQSPQKAHRESPTGGVSRDLASQSRKEDAHNIAARVEALPGSLQPRALRRLPLRYLAGNSY